MTMLLSVRQTYAHNLRKKCGQNETKYISIGIIRKSRKDGLCRKINLENQSIVEGSNI
jgi:hypothetical protein